MLHTCCGLEYAFCVIVMCMVNISTYMAIYCMFTVVYIHYTHTHTCTHIHTRTHIHTHTHAHTHTHTHKHTQSTIHSYTNAHTHLCYCYVLDATTNAHTHLCYCYVLDATDQIPERIEFTPVVEKLLNIAGTDPEINQGGWLAYISG